MRKPSKLKQLAPGHRASKWPGRDLNLGSSTAKPGACSPLSSSASRKTASGESRERAPIQTVVVLGPELAGAAPRPVTTETSEACSLSPFHSLNRPQLQALCSVALSRLGPERGIQSPRASAPGLLDFTPPPLGSMICARVHQCFCLTETPGHSGFPPPP